MQRKPVPTACIKTSSIRLRAGWVAQVLVRYTPPSQSHQGETITTEAQGIADCRLPIADSGLRPPEQPAMATPKSETPNRQSEIPCPFELPSAEGWRDPLETLLAESDDAPHRTFLKHSASGDVFRTRFAIGGGPGGHGPPCLEVVCKTSRTPRLFRRLAGRWLGVGQSRERRNWHRALRLLRTGVNTALPLALLERTSAKGESWLITKALSDVTDLDHLASAWLQQLDIGRVRAVKNALIERIVDLLCRMERERLWHRDFKASNILVTDWETDARSGPCLWLVDLDGIHRRTRFSISVCWRPVIRLAASLAGQPEFTRTDRLRFLIAYRSRIGAPPRSWKRDWRTLARKVDRYNRRAKKRKRGKIEGFTGKT